MNPARDVALWLESQNVGSRVSAGHTWWIRQTQLDPDRAQPQIGVIPSGGLAPELHLTGITQRLPTVQVRIRGEAQKFASSLAKANEVFTTLGKTRISGEDVWIITPVGEPLWLGYDDSGSPEWSLNFQLEPA